MARYRFEAQLSVQVLQQAVVSRHPLIADLETERGDGAVRQRPSHHRPPASANNQNLTGTGLWVSSGRGVT